MEQRLADISTAVEKLRLDEIENSLTNEKIILEMKCEINSLERKIESIKDSNKQLESKHKYDIEARSAAKQILEKCPKCKANNWVRIYKIYENCIYNTYLLHVFILHRAITKMNFVGMAWMKNEEHQQIIFCKIFCYSSN